MQTAPPCQLQSTAAFLEQHQLAAVRPQVAHLQVAHLQLAQVAQVIQGTRGFWVHGPI